ncbi:neutral zinc metallopeptidase [Nocardiopsis oceani]
MENRTGAEEPGENTPPPPERGPAQPGQGQGQHWPNPGPPSQTQPQQAQQTQARPLPPHAPPAHAQPQPPQAGFQNWQWGAQQWPHQGAQHQPWQQQRGPHPWAQYQHWGPSHGRPPPRPRRDRGPAVIAWAFVAASVALVALIASVAIVATTPQEEPETGGTDVSVYYDSDLYVQPDPVDVDLVDHPVYGVAVPEPVDCDLPALDLASDESWEGFADEAGNCLDELWAPVMAELGLVPELPDITVTDDSLDTDTEDAFTLAYYESDRSQITVVLPNVREVGAQVPADHQEHVWLALMGHEYAHHVQYATGILSVSHDLRRTAGTEADELDTLRRTELQAECMAGVGLRGLTDPDSDALDVVNQHFNGDGDLETHGSAANRALWLESGWSSETVGDCNTYAADEPDVA